MKKIVSSFVLAVVLFVPQILRAQDSVVVTFAVNDTAKGSINPGPGTYSFAAGEEYSITATSNEGYQLMGWIMTFEGGGPENLRNIDTAVATLTTTASVVDGHAAYTVTAVFATADTCADCFTLDLGINHKYMGSLTLEPGIHHFGLGDQFVIFAEPNEGYEFLGWYVSFVLPGYGITQEEVVMVDVNCLGPVVVNTDFIGAVNTIVAIFDGPEVSIGDVDAGTVTLRGIDGHIVLNGAEGREVYVFDIYGRMLYHNLSANTTETYAVPSAGTYLVKVDGVKTKQVVVVR